MKLSGDGTWIGKRLHFLNITFTVLDKGVLAYCSDGNHPLALLKEPEKSLQRGLEDLRNEVERLTEIVVDGETYQIDYYLGGDWKFLACITGIDSARSQYACIWCKCSMTDRADVEKKGSISNPSLGARTIEENITLSKLPKSKKSYNVSNPPLFPTILLTKVVIDNLHLFLRVSDGLIDRFIVQLQVLDAIDKSRKLSLFDPHKFKHLDSFQRFVTSLGIPNFRFWVGQNSKVLKW